MKTFAGKHRHVKLCGGIAGFDSVGDRNHHSLKKMRFKAGEATTKMEAT